MTDYLRPIEVAALLHISPKTLARWAKEGRIASVRTPGGHRRYDPVVVKEWVEHLSDPDYTPDLVRR